MLSTLLYQLLKPVGDFSWIIAQNVGRYVQNYDSSFHSLRETGSRKQSILTAFSSPLHHHQRDRNINFKCNVWISLGDPFSYSSATHAWAPNLSVCLLCRQYRAVLPQYKWGTNVSCHSHNSNIVGIPVLESVLCKFLYGTPFIQKH